MGEEYWVKLKLSRRDIDIIKGLAPQMAKSPLERVGVILGNGIQNGAFDCTVTPIMPTVEIMSPLKD